MNLNKLINVHFMPYHNLSANYNDILLLFYKFYLKDEDSDVFKFQNHLPTMQHVGRHLDSLAVFWTVRK